MKKVFLFVVLAVMSNTTFAAMTETCQKYINEVDSIIEQASKSSEQAKQQMEAMKPQLEESKKQLAAMPEDQQDAGCKQAVESLVQMKKALGIQ